MKKALLVGLVVSLLATVAGAGALDGYANAFSSGSTTFGYPSSSLKGHVDWAVFMPGNFPFAGYTPDAGEAVYAYQVFNEGTTPINVFFVVLQNAANDVGSFVDLAGVDPSVEQLFGPSGQARWTFDENILGNIQPGQNSGGLAFSSPKMPTMFQGGTIDGGLFEWVVPLPVPSPTDVPEPATMGLLLVSGVAVLIRRKKK